MSEVTKLYENAGVELNEGLEWVCQNPDHCAYQNLSVTPENCIGCEHFEREMRFPPFTAEKQIELFKWLIQKYKDISIEHKLNLFYINIRDIYTGMVHIEFDETVAGLINNLWQDLTEKEKQQVKGILE